MRLLFCSVHRKMVSQTSSPSAYELPSSNRSQDFIQSLVTVHLHSFDLTHLFKVIETRIDGLWCHSQKQSDLLRCWKQLKLLMELPNEVEYIMWQYFEWWLVWFHLGLSFRSNDGDEAGHPDLTCHDVDCLLSSSQLLMKATVL